MRNALMASVAATALLILVGCGGGGDHKSSKVCEMNVPEWTGNTLSISSIPEAKKALTPIMMVMDWQIGENESSKPKGKVEKSRNLPPELNGFYEQLRSGDWLVKGLQAHSELPLSKRVSEQTSSERECDYGGKMKYIADSGGDANRTWQYYQLQFQKCVVATETIEDMLNQLLSNTPVFVNTLAVEESEEPNSTVTLNGLLELNISKPNTGPGYFIIASNSSGKPTQESNATFARFTARNFTANLVDKSDPDTPIKGYVGANISMDVWAVHIESAETDIDLGLETTGCAALRVSAGDEQFINANFTADHAVLEYNRTREDNNTLRFSVRYDGYAGIDGMLDPSIISKPAEDEEAGLSIFQYYGEDLQVNALYHEDTNESEITINGAFGTTCMGGVVDYNASFVEMFDNGWLAAVNGEILLNGGEAVLTMQNQTFTLTVGEQEETGRGPWPFIDDNCSNSFDIFGLLLDNFVWW